MTHCLTLWPPADLLLATTSQLTFSMKYRYRHHPGPSLGPLMHRALGVECQTNKSDQKMEICSTLFTLKSPLWLSLSNWFIAPGVKDDGRLTEQWTPVCECVCMHVPSQAERMTLPTLMSPVTVGEFIDSLWLLFLLLEHPSGSVLKAHISFLFALACTLGVCRWKQQRSLNSLGYTEDTLLIRSVLCIWQLEYQDIAKILPMMCLPSHLYAVYA